MQRPSTLVVVWLSRGRANNWGGTNPRLWFRRAMADLASNPRVVEFDLDLECATNHVLPPPPNEAGFVVILERERRHPEEEDEDNGAPSEEDLDHLFGSVLPRHPSLVEVAIRNAPMPSSRFEAFCEAMANATEPSPLRSLELSGTVLDNATAPAAIAQLLQNRTAIPNLRKLRLSGTMLNGDSLQQICDAVPFRPNLRALHFAGFVEAVIRSDTLVGALGPTSSLRTFKVCARFTKDGVMSVVQALKRNETLQHLELLRIIEGMNDLVHDEFRMLLTHHNFTLRRISLFFWRELDNETQLRAIMRRNVLVQGVHDHLKYVKYEFELYKLWPIVLGVMSRFPTLLLRFLRRGNVLGLAAILSGTADLSLPTGTGRGHAPCEIL